VSQTASKLAEHIVKSNKAMAVLFQNQHHESALILIYSWVDRLAWLSVESEDSSGPNFKAWLNKYLLTETSTLPCNANDLWASRCSILHTGTAEARDVKKGKARSVYYYGGPIEVTAKNNDTEVFVNIGHLHVGLIEASNRFLQYLEKNTRELEVTNKKLGKILNRITNI
jgi:hypothetical protein